MHRRHRLFFSKSWLSRTKLLKIYDFWVTKGCLQTWCLSAACSCSLQGGVNPIKYYLKELPPLLLWIFSAVALFAVVLLIPCELLVSTFLTVTRTPFAWEANKIYSSCHQTAWLYSCHFQQSPYKALRDVHWPSFVARDSFTAFLSSSLALPQANFLISKQWTTQPFGSFHVLCSCVFWQKVSDSLPSLECF